MLRILVGTQLRRLREQCGMSREAAADIIRGSEAKMSRLELGRTGFKQRDVVDLLAAYGVTDDAEREAVLGLARRANEPGWWQPYNDVMPGWLELYVGLEQAASVIRSYEAQFIPGLLQTEAYAQSVIELGQVARPADVKERVALRMRRQQLLEDPASPDLWVVVDEAALRRTMGNIEVMRGQLEHLQAMMKRPRVTVQIVPFTRSGQVATGGPFTLLRFAEPDLPDIVYLEQLTSAFYVDKREDVETYLEVIDRLSATALTPAESADVVAAARATL
ncbi:helix-turn-helix domain-containing protein [Actinomycetospora cinnamomea]|uniref:Helix-turn-helix protein n=1 Tax=Actinomycetospora cinnamomea TaxID=663609 RepID=A0A2U1FAZ4_9PSEU|nr:helix-turn-helix transcriptional regulator [Actinomycetospora cinnamomea]PVZ09361.1 helix-turn-helix protein [Actinomycetospora cinnamomea]